MKYFFLLLIFLVGCITPKKVSRYLKENEKEAASYCADAFPVKDSIIKVTESVLYDTVYLYGSPLYDTLFLQGESYIVEKDCPPNKVITKTVRVDSIIARRDIAQETTLRLSIKELSESNGVLMLKSNEYKEKAQKRGLYLWALVAILALWVCRKPLFFLLKKAIMPV